MARGRGVRTRHRRLLPVLVCPADSQRTRGTRNAWRHAHRLLSSELHGSQVFAGSKAIAASVNAVKVAVSTVADVAKNASRLATGSLRPSPGIHAGVLRFHAAHAEGRLP